MARLFRKPAFWLVSLLVLICLYFAATNLMEVRTRTKAVMMVQKQVLDKPHITAWLKKQQTIGPFKLDGWDMSKDKTKGTYVVSYTISREDPTKQNPTVHEGFWFRVNPRDGTCLNIPCPESES